MSLGSLGTSTCLVDVLGVSKRSEGRESKQGGESKVWRFCVVALVRSRHLVCPSASKEATVFTLFLGVVYPYSSWSPVVVEALQHPGSLGQYFAGLTSRVCSLRFNLALSLLLLPLLPDLSVLAWRTHCPLLVYSNFKCIWRWSSVSMSSLEKQPQFYLPTCFPDLWLYYMTLKSIIITFLCSCIEFQG